MRDFNRPVDEQDFSLMAKGSLAWAVVHVRGIKTGKAGPYADIELTIDEGHPYRRRKIWKALTDPDNPGLPDTAVNMSIAAIKHMLEVGKQAHPETNPSGYHISDGPTGLSELNGLRVAIQIGIEDEPGYQPKNIVQNFLSPLSGAQSIRDAYQKLTAGDFNIQTKPATAAPTSGFGNAVPAGTTPPPHGATNGSGGFAPQATATPPTTTPQPAASSELDDEIPF